MDGATGPNSSVAITIDAVITKINLLHPTNCTLFILTIMWTKSHSLDNGTVTVASFSSRVGQLRKLSKLCLFGSLIFYVCFG